MTDTQRRPTEVVPVRADRGSEPTRARGPGRDRRRRPGSSEPPRMRKFRERNLRVIGAVSAAVLILAVVGALNLSSLPLISHTRHYQAEFANAGGLTSGEIVTVAGVRVGTIGKISLVGSHVQVAFTLTGGTHLGGQTAAAARVLTPIGQEYLALLPAGSGSLDAPIPLSRTTIPSTLVGDLSTLSTETGQINIPQLVTALDQTTANIQGIPSSEVGAALSGLARFSAIIASRQQDLSVLVTSASNLAGVLASHTSQLVDLVGQGDLVLKVLEARRVALRNLLATTSTLSAQITSLLGQNKTQLVSLLHNLQTVTAILAKDANDVGAALPLVASFARYSANATGSGPFADFTLPTLLIPDNVIAQCSTMDLSDPLRGCRV